MFMKMIKTQTGSLCKKMQTIRPKTCSKTTDKDALRQQLINSNRIPSSHSQDNITNHIRQTSSINTHQQKIYKKHFKISCQICL